MFEVVRTAPRRARYIVHGKPETTSLFSRQLAGKQLAEARGGHAQPDVELAEERVNGADFVEAHLVDELLEDERIFAVQIDAPLPIVEADRPADDLLHFAGV